VWWWGSFIVSVHLLKGSLLACIILLLVAGASPGQARPGQAGRTRPLFFVLYCQPATGCDTTMIQSIALSY
jgi:hypothetical protein